MTALSALPSSNGHELGRVFLLLNFSLLPIWVEKFVSNNSLSCYAENEIFHPNKFEKDTGWRGV
ncbi:hypothetical protein NC99_37930 [Sunxiuqinia dokdonensis]|uniref:Uncharacterized protein n=1 Tax=Sunxiuqinia dokdonensis TaxID=1409788 RepID=A0A0L8V4K3_9BACT|nr:hypothetical protein NC99_37930 [Sunxiuqinia dokdonensis]